MLWQGLWRWVHLPIFCSQATNAEQKQDVEQLLDSANHTIASESEIAEVSDGEIVTAIYKNEYLQLAKNSCVEYLSNDSTRFNAYPDRLIIRTKNGNLTLLNLTYDEEVASDFSIEWQYDGYKAGSKMSFFSFGGY